MKIRDIVTGHEHEARLVWEVGAEHPAVTVRGITVPLNPLYFKIIEALPEEVAALSPAWRKALKGAQP